MFSSPSGKMVIPCYIISYCSLIPLNNNKYKIKLIAREQVPKIMDRKFFAQVGLGNDSEEIIKYCKRESLKKLFFIFMIKIYQKLKIYFI